MVKPGYFLKGLMLCFVASAMLGSLRAETAKENYRLYCVQCHGTAGSGGGITSTGGGLRFPCRSCKWGRTNSG